MPKLFRRLLFEGGFSKHHSIDVPIPGREDSVEIHPFELIVPIAVSPSRFLGDELELNVFPAKIDTGFNHNLILSHRHLTDSDWANQKLEDFSAVAKKPISIRLADGIAREFWQRDADLWIVGNQKENDYHEVNLRGGLLTLPEFHPDEYEDGRHVGPLPGELPKEPLGPRLPLLGGKALSKAGALLEVDYLTSTFRLHVPE